MLSPIALFTFNRPSHFLKTINALKSNFLADKSDLIIFSDNAKDISEQSKVNEVRELLQDVKGFHSTTIIKRKENYGLSKNIIDGVTRVCQEYGKVIVLEDDMITSPHFLTYMNDALNCYVDTTEVASIHAYTYPVAEKLPETFFLKGADCWGWGTWERAWKLFNPNGSELLRELKEKKLTKEFDFSGSYPYTKMLKQQIAGKNDSWAIRWYASIFLENKLTLYPGKSLVHNIGNDMSGTHCGDSPFFCEDLDINYLVKATHVSPKESEIARESFRLFFKRIKSPWWSKYFNKIS